MHELAVKPRFYELDPYNHLNHSVYVSWFELGRIEALESIGLSMHSLGEQNLSIVVVRLTLTFSAPVNAGDELVIKTHITELGSITSTWTQELYSNQRQCVVATAKVDVGVVDANGHPTRRGASLKTCLSALLVP